MSDQELQRLKSAAERTGAMEASVAYAAALDRAGRSTESFNVLLPFSHDPSVRAALLDRPAWTNRFGDAGQTRYYPWSQRSLKKGEVQWTYSRPSKRRRPPEQDMTSLETLLASPLAVVVMTDERTVVALDPLSGVERWRTKLKSKADGSLVLMRDTLVIAQNDQIQLRDLATGEELSQRSFAQHSVQALVFRAADRRVLPSWSHPATRGADARVVAWRDQLLAFPKAGSLRGMVTGRGAFFLLPDSHPSRWRWVDMDTGQDLGTLPPGSLLCADDDGFVTYGFEPGSPRAPWFLSMLDLEGNERWRFEEAVAKVLTPRYVVALPMPVGDATETLILDRQTGQLCWKVSGAGCCAWVGDDLCVGTSKFTVTSGGLGTRWELGEQELDFKREGGVTAIAALPGRIFIRQDSGVVRCIRV